MRLRNVTVAIAVSVLSAAGAIGSYLHVSRLRSDANWLMARGDAQAVEYSRSLDGQVVEAQLATFDERRAILTRAYAWQRVEIILILLSVTAAMCSYVLHLYGRLQEQLEDVQSAVPGSSEPRSHPNDPSKSTV